MSYPDGRIDTPTPNTVDENDMAKVLAVCPLSREDLAGFLACSHEERVALVQAYKDAGVMPTASAWTIVLDVMRVLESLANMVIPVESAVSSVFGLVEDL